MALVSVCRSGTLEPSWLPPGTHWISKPKAGSAIDHGPRTWDWRCEPDTPENTRGVTASHEVWEIGNAIAETWKSDAHAVPYVVRTASGEPLRFHSRMSTKSIGLLKQNDMTISAEVLMFDVDHSKNPDGTKGVWTPERESLYKSQVAQLPTMVTWKTSHGWHGAQPMSRPVAYGEEYNDTMASFLASLVAVGVVYDSQATDFFRYMRLAFVTRGGKPYRSAINNLARMRPIEPPRGVKAKKKARNEVAGVGDPTRSTFGDALRKMGWLGPIAGEFAIIACPNRAQHGSNTDMTSSTVLYAPLVGATLGKIHCSHAHCKDLTPRDWIQLFPVGTFTDYVRVNNEAVAEAAKSISLVDAVEACKEIAKLLSSASAGVQVIAASCGTGKSHAALAAATARYEIQVEADARHALEDSAKNTRAALRADKLGVDHVTKEVNHRASVSSKTTIIEPTNEMAIQMTDNLRDRGVKVRRLFGITSQKTRQPDGTVLYGCQYGAVAEVLQSGGVSVPSSFCPKCNIKDTCEVRIGADGPDDASVTVASIAAHAASAGASDLVVLDDSTNLFKTTTFGVGEVKEALNLLRYFEENYGIAMAPMLWSMIAFVDRLPEHEMEADDPESVVGDKVPRIYPLSAALDFEIPTAARNRALERFNTAEPVACAELAFAPKHIGAKSTLLSPQTLAMIMGGNTPTAQVKKLAAAGRVIDALYEAAMVSLSDFRVILTVSFATFALKVSDELALPRTVRQVTIKHVDPVMVSVLGRNGPTFILDAAADARMGALASIIPYPLVLSDPRHNRFHGFEAKDAQRVIRTMAATSSMGRSRLMPGDRINHDLLASALRVVGEWAGESPISERVALVTYQAVEMVIADALAGRGPQVVIDALRWSTADVDGVAPMPGLVRLALGHHNALRGLDKWKSGYDIANIGDPRVNLDDVRMERSVFSEGETVSSRLNSLAAFELDQVFGRGRYAHTLRLHDGSVSTAIRKALNIAEVIPAGWHARGYVDRPVQLGASRLTPIAGMDQDELRALIAAFGGSQPAFAKVARVAPELLKSHLASGSARRQILGREAAVYRAVAPMEKAEPVANPRRDDLAAMVERWGGPSKAARRAGISVGSIHRYLSGRAIPDDVLATLAMPASAGIPAVIGDSDPANDAWSGGYAADDAAVAF